MDTMGSKDKLSGGAVFSAVSGGKKAARAALFEPFRGPVQCLNGGSREFPERGCATIVMFQELENDLCEGSSWRRENGVRKQFDSKSTLMWEFSIIRPQNDLKVDFKLISCPRRS
jgi:hypothetical protein